jgi:glycosyltransferase involved in cell wall biosynthesis
VTSQNQTGSSGISVVICCYNSAEVLPRTLEHLYSQQVPAGLQWEVIVIDNASTDGTAAIALQSWPKGAPAPLRLFEEQRSGTRYARELGIQQSVYDLISFVDDDNWVCPTWVRGAFEAMALHPEAGACGGRSIPEFETQPPQWFENVKVKWAISADHWEGGDITDSRGGLFSAGCTFRKAALAGIYDAGFQPLTTGSRGGKTIGSEDTELCYMLRLAGWRLWYDPSLTFRHYIRAQRLTWKYARRLFRGFGYGDAHTDAYVRQLHGGGSRLDRSWWWQFLVNVSHLFRRPGRFLRTTLRSCEGDLAALRTEIYVGRFRALLDTRHEYRNNLAAVGTLAARLREQQQGGLQ